jgi:hypothetical protein
VDSGTANSPRPDDRVPGDDGVELVARLGAESVVYICRHTASLCEACHTRRSVDRLDKR